MYLICTAEALVFATIQSLCGRNEVLIWSTLQMFSTAVVAFLLTKSKRVRSAERSCSTGLVRGNKYNEAEHQDIEGARQDSSFSSSHSSVGYIQTYRIFAIPFVLVTQSIFRFISH
jgi:hypothetical protein